jgi:hypothetical protein
MMTPAVDDTGCDSCAGVVMLSHSTPEPGAVEIEDLGLVPDHLLDWAVRDREGLSVGVGRPQGWDAIQARLEPVVHRVEVPVFHLEDGDPNVWVEEDEVRAEAIEVWLNVDFPGRGKAIEEEVKNQLLARSERGPEPSQLAQGRRNHP